MHQDNKNFYFLVIDLEATCSDDKSIPRHQTEIIEIGAVMLNRSTWEVDAEYQQFIQPIRHPLLTDFCTQLTTIQQADIEKAPKFPEAIMHLQKWMSQFPKYTFCSWGDYDKRQFIQDCKFHKIPYPLTPEHINIKKQFSEYLGVSQAFGMADALAKLGFELIGTHHRGIDDARNIAKILRHMETVK
ncbi:3'-5' exonuclease [Calothrix sp. UHCC 0171]|uniref:3'-5' exonuclease n=1 Tax=Calothrix sp. UHCC 0171 TaxID=3110245 RepID=UPI002B21DEBA|nr:3'-5' exonuclease [Calothrix sp. UHCC 0171]MEA5572326.1 3'-5' exonuclease [Calothrix sp. UHCC 0171]